MAVTKKTSPNTLFCSVFLCPYLQTTTHRLIYKLQLQVTHTNLMNRKVVVFGGVVHACYISSSFCNKVSTWNCTNKEAYMDELSSTLDVIKSTLREQLTSPKKKKKKKIKMAYDIYQDRDHHPTPVRRSWVQDLVVIIYQFISALKIRLSFYLDKPKTLEQPINRYQSCRWDHCGLWVSPQKKCAEKQMKNSGRWWQDDKSQLRIKQILFACNFAQVVV